jgi:hypothetical protein
MSTDAALVLANLIPLHLKIREISIKRALGPLAGFLPPSTLSLVANDLLYIANSPQPKNRTLISHQARLTRCITLKAWNCEWKSSKKSGQTGLFFPSIESAQILNDKSLPFFTARVLSGHCGLNKCLYNYRILNSPLCLCGLSEESLSHVLFDCVLYLSHRGIFAKSLCDAGSAWPPSFSLFAKSSQAWIALMVFMCATKRFRDNGRKNILL